MKNPFIYGGRVSGEAFWDREREVKELLRDILSRQNVILFSQRRFGKTSLVWKALEEAKKEGLVTVYADLYPVSTVGEFIEGYAKAIAQALGMYEKSIKLMRDLFSRIYLSMGVDPDGNPKWSVGFDRDNEMESFDEVMSSLERHLKRKKRYGVVVFDEFQQIIETDGDKIERRMRSAIQSHERISYIFVGSKRHLLSEIFSNPNRPFYRSGKVFPLEKLPQDDLKKMIRKQMNNAGVSIADRALQAIVTITECHPYYTQYLCHILYDMMEKPEIEAEDIPGIVDLLLKRESTAYMNTWDMLTHRQRQALQILSDTGPGENPFRAEMLRRYNISQQAVMIRALTSLMGKDLVDKQEGRYEIIDLFFKRWIRRFIVKS